MGTATGINDIVDITTGYNPMREGIVALGGNDDIYNGVRLTLDVATALVPGGGASSGARAASNVARHGDEVVGFVASGASRTARSGADNVAGSGASAASRGASSGAQHATPSSSGAPKPSAAATSSSAGAGSGVNSDGLPVGGEITGWTRHGTE